MCYGIELTCNAVLAWCSEARINWHHIAPGKPMKKGYEESVNGRICDELFNKTLFMRLDHHHRQHRVFTRAKSGNLSYRLGFYGVKVSPGEGPT